MKNSDMCVAQSVKEVIFDVPMLRISDDVCKEKSEESFQEVDEVDEEVSGGGSPCRKN